jgi:predicted Zn finger-like uncharacterized protein
MGSQALVGLPLPVRNSVEPIENLRANQPERTKPMIVECPGCRTIFPVDPKKIPDAGVNARCSRCSEVFFIAKPEPELVEAEVQETASAPEPPPAPVTPPVSAPMEGELSGEDLAQEEEPESFEEPQPETFGAGEEPSAVEPAFDKEVAVEPPPEVEPVGEPLRDAASEVEAAAADVVAEIEAPAGEVPTAVPSFGKRDPGEKAKRLARVLVSDIILYNPDRHHQAMESGRVKEEFEEEIQKSWDEYVEQVGDEVANSTTFFTDALNEILAKGEEVF